jgi:hypothetical protein
MSGRKSVRAALAALVLACACAAGAYAATPGVIADSYVILEDEIMDIRVNASIRTANGKDIGDFSSMEDLVVGSYFLSEDGTALQVTAITKNGDEVVIETIQPELSTVVAEAYMPDQEVVFSTANIVPGSLAEGVTLLDGDSEFSMVPRGSLATGPTWIDTETVTDVQKAEIIAVAMEFKLSGEKSAEAYGLITGTIGGEVGLKGQLRVAYPTLKGGLKMPSIKIKWVKVWAFIGYPVVEFENGYIHASFYSGEQIDAKLYGTATLGVEVKIPLYTLLASNESGTITFLVGLYLKISAEGSITLAFEINEYARLGVWGTVELFWPFIPIDISAGSDFYYDFALRPSLAGSIEVKAGPYLGLEGTIVGTKILSVEVGGGLYASAEGSIEAADVLGLDETVGTYGDITKWTYEASAEAGGYIEATLSIADIWDTTLLDKKWPFIKISGKGEL